jgi:predicted O-methyltransferase YrrM
MKGLVRLKCRKWLGSQDYVSIQRTVRELNTFIHLRRAVIELNDVGELRKVFGWQLEPILDNPTIYDFDYIEDVNQRRVRDAESLATVVCNAKPSICLDIGTSTGYSAALMAVNMPKSQVYTVNIPPEEILSGEGGNMTTIALEREKIGFYYRERKLTNITQIFANTAQWEPNIGTIDVAFVDGCHDTDFVYNDTRKILKHAKPGSFVLWHDFNLELVNKYDWIHSVCLGVEKLFADGLVRGRVFHIRDSWLGIYRIEEKA